jgi:hypothetical protein
MEFLKYRRETFKKYFYDYDKIFDDLEVMNEITSSYWDVMVNSFKSNGDNRPSLRKFNNATGKYELYSPNSKHYTLADPNVTNTRSIQYSSLERIYMLFKNKHTGEFEFPTIPMYKGDSFIDVKYKLFLNLTKENWKIFWEHHHPSFQVTRDLHEYEKADPKNKGYNGVRTYYYNAYHFRGRPEIAVNKLHPYEDFIFATKREMNNVTSRPYWNAIIGSMQEQ